ncbi:MAG: hypothetical protein K9H49_00185 [Bacteroidales bacterium]|nr:hypothetical protein [Bacteroidales bacterium]MCF8389271.1 hypothetical protein [Bacteroidales bacterium]
MKKFIVSALIIAVFIAFSCKKDEESERFTLLTSISWFSDTLLANGVDASGPGQMLEKFKGEVIFNKDGSGTFGGYVGTWHFAYDETKVVLASDSLIMPLTTNIEELTKTSLKVTTSFPNFSDPENPTDIRMTFKPK